ncbi:MAG: hypothetical protein WEB00_05890 [Dehalococcoidia bacterium]
MSFVGRRWLRPGLILLAVFAALPGLWALLAPENFHTDFPGGGRSWVAPLGAYNEHMVRDFGALNLALAAVLGLAAYYLERRVVDVALIGSLVWQVPHFIFHVIHADELGNGDAAVQTISLVVVLVITVLLLAINNGGKLLPSLGSPGRP